MNDAVSPAKGPNQISLEEWIAKERAKNGLVDMKLCLDDGPKNPRKHSPEAVAGDILTMIADYAAGRCTNMSDAEI